MPQGLICTLLCVLASTAIAQPSLHESSKEVVTNTDSSSPKPSLSNGEKGAIIREIGELFEERYVFREKGEEIQRALQATHDEGEFDLIVEPEAFRRAFRDVVRDVVDDKHIMFIPHRSEEHDGDLNRKQHSSDLHAQFVGRKAVNFGVPELRVMDENIGYIRITKFTSPELFGPVIRASSEYLRHVDGLIIDLRSRGGGRSEAVVLLLSYFLAPNSHVFDWHFRGTTDIERNWTLPYVDGHHFDDVPVYILTSQETFSGSEAFCYAMKHHGRATIVGETTRGGAHTYEEVLIADRYLALVPVGRAVLPITNQNWEGRGVVPTLAATADDAFELARTKLLEELRE